MSWLTAAPQVLLEGLQFAEGLRWHDGALWLSDLLSRKVLAVGTDGTVEQKAHVPGQPSGLGFRSDGTPLVVSMLDRKLAAIVDRRPLPVAALDGACVGMSRLAGVPQMCSRKFLTLAVSG